MGKRQVTGKFFRIFFNQGRNYHFGVVHAPKEIDILDLPETGHYVDNWHPISFTLKSDGGELSDFPTSNVCESIYSPKLKGIIDKNQTSNDVPIQWLPVTITKEKSGESFDYFYLHFLEICDSLDEEETISSKSGVIMRPCFSLEKIQGRSICNCRGSSLLLMSKALRKAIMEAECTGLKFEQAIVLEEYEEENQSSDKIVNL